MTNVNQLAKSEGLAVAVNASFFEMRSGLFSPMGPTVVDGKELPSYLDSEIEKEKYGVFYCSVNNECNISTLFEYSDLFSNHGKHPNLVVSGMSWSIKSGVVHPKGSGIQTNRTVIGLSKDQKTLYLVHGFGSYLAIANAIQKAGAYNAFNFDGGGSSQLVFRDQKYPEFPKSIDPDLKGITPEDFFENQRPVPIILGVSELP
jgi:exopolysaccharide biosynthesis protein